MTKSNLNRLAIVALASTGFSFPATAMPNLVQNGSFESTSLASPGGTVCAPGSSSCVSRVTNWSSQCNPNIGAICDHNSLIDLVSSGSNGSGFNNHNALWGPVPDSPDGGNFIAGDGDPFYATPIWQSVSGLNVGNHYTLSFYQAAAQQHGLNGATTEQWAVTFGGVTQYTSLQHNPSHGFQPWTQQTLDFVATSSTQVLNFLAVGTPSGLPPISLLDGVSLTEVSQVGGAPEPSSWMMMLAGFGLFGAASRRRRVRASLQA